MNARSQRGTLFIRAPNHLGDGVMALPAVAALVRAFETTFVQAPPWGPVVYGATGATVSVDPPPGADVAVLMGPSFRFAWEARRIRRRVGLATDGRSLLLTDRVPMPSGHRSQEYAAVARALGVEVEGPPRLQVEPAPVEPFIGLNPVSRSGAPVLWPGFPSLSRELEGPVRVFCGPGEERMVEGVRGEATVGLPLDQLVRVLARCRVLVSNDTGVAHLAAACGARVVVVHGSTTASRTGVAGAVPVEGPDLPCRPCYRKRCRLVGPTDPVPCLQVPQARVLEALNRLLPRGEGP